MSGVCTHDEPLKFWFYIFKNRSLVDLCQNIRKGIEIDIDQTCERFQIIWFWLSSRRLDDYIVYHSRNIHHSKNFETKSWDSWSLNLSRVLSKVEYFDLKLGIRGRSGLSGNPLWNKTWAGPRLQVRINKQREKSTIFLCWPTKVFVPRKC